MLLQALLWRLSLSLTGEGFPAIHPVDLVRFRASDHGRKPSHPGGLDFRSIDGRRSGYRYPAKDAGR